jgi:DNA repair protein RecN (Recombination protein N)
VRHGAERAEVSATFGIEGNAAALAWLAAQEVEHDGEVILRRSVAADGRGRAWINGQSMPVQSLRALGERLVDVHGQLEFQSLARRGYQRDTLDVSGGLDAHVVAMRDAYRHWRDLAQERATLEQRGRDREGRIDLLSHYLAELEALAPQPDETRALGDERRRMSALGRLAEGTAQVERLLAGDSGDVASALGRAQTQLATLAGIDPTLAGTAQLLDEAAIACREAVVALRRYAETLEADPARQEWVESRLAALEAASRKHRVDAGALPQFMARLAAELDALRADAVSVADIERRLAALCEARDQAAQRLGEARRRTAQALDDRVTALMQELGMSGGRFVTRLEVRAAETCSEHGVDEIEFLVSANPGQPPRPLAKVASGGELSRISLALQVATLDARHLPCLVFDEVDAGIGGAVAEMVGRQLEALAVSGQVLCVTHLAQVAAQADHQLRVAKLTTGGSTRTSIEALADDARVQELARMLGGAQITARTLEHARELLESRRHSRISGLRRTATTSSGGADSPGGRSGRARSAHGR